MLEQKTMEYVDYYEVLGVAKDVSASDLKKKYRQLARKYHPDVSDAADAEDRIKQINEAYDVLKDPEKRAAYDQLGANWKQGQDFHPPPGFDFGDGGSFSDIFESMFSQGGFSSGGFSGGGFGGFGGGGFGSQAGGGFAQRGQDLQTSLNVDLLQAFRGDEVSVNISGRNLNIKIPKGIKRGQKIRLSGQGQAGVGGGPSGDLLVEVEINKHAVYKLDGNNIEMQLPVAPWEAALGAKVNVPLPNGKKIQLKIPEGSQAGSKMRIPGKGMPGKVSGDFFVITKIEIPVAETDEQRAYYEKMQELFDFSPREKD